MCGGYASVNVCYWRSSTQGSPRGLLTPAQFAGGHKGRPGELPGGREGHPRGFQPRARSGPASNTSDNKCKGCSCLRIAGLSERLLRSAGRSRTIRFAHRNVLAAICKPSTRRLATRATNMQQQNAVITYMMKFAGAIYWASTIVTALTMNR
jgi:hypothetical protein